MKKHDDKFIELFNKRVNRKIDSLNKFRKISSDESILDSSISFLLHEIVRLELYIEDIKNTNKKHETDNN
jgi:hypothetical protein